jgi:hypothetical protein
MAGEIGKIGEIAGKLAEASRIGSEESRVLLSKELSEQIAKDAEKGNPFSRNLESMKIQYDGKDFKIRDGTILSPSQFDDMFKNMYKGNLESFFKDVKIENKSILENARALDGIADKSFLGNVRNAEYSILGKAYEGASKEFKATTKEAGDIAKDRKLDPKTLEEANKKFGELEKQNTELKNITNDLQKKIEEAKKEGKGSITTKTGNVIKFSLLALAGFSLWGVIEAQRRKTNGCFIENLESGEIYKLPYFTCPTEFDEPPGEKFGLAPTSITDKIKFCPGGCVNCSLSESKLCDNPINFKDIDIKDQIECDGNLPNPNCSCYCRGCSSRIILDDLGAQWTIKCVNRNWGEVLLDVANKIPEASIDILGKFKSVLKYIFYFIIAIVGIKVILLIKTFLIGGGK